MKASNFSQVLLLLLCLLLLAYSTAKAFLIPFTYDEIYSFQEYVVNNFTTFSTYYFMDANNHILNTWLMEIMYKIAGYNEFVLRIPNLIAHIIFLFYSLKFAKKMPSQILIIAAFLILNLNPLLIDYFSLARGYGLSMAFMMGSMYYASKFFEPNDKKKYAFFSICFCAIALLANINIILYFLISSCLIFLINYLRNQKESVNYIEQNNIELLKSSLLLLSPLVILFFIVPIILNLKNAGAFYYGNNEGLWAGTIKSLIYKIVNENLIIKRYLPIMEILVLLVLIISCFQIFLEIKNKIKFSFNYFLLITLLLSGVFIFLLHLCIDVKFPVGRTVIYFCPIFFLMVIFVSKQIYFISKKTANVFASLFGILLLCNFFMSFNLHSIIQYNIRDEVRKMTQFLNENKKKLYNNRKIYTIGVSSEFEQDVNAYRFLLHLNWLDKPRRAEVFHHLNDYYFIHKSEIKLLPKIKFKIIKEFENTQTALVENQQNWKTKLIYIEKKDFENDANPNTLIPVAYGGTHCSVANSLNQFSDGFNYAVNDSLMTNKNAVLELNAFCYSELSDFESYLIISYERNSKPILYQSRELRELMKKSKVWERVSISSFCPTQIKKGDEIKYYLWNVGKGNVYIDDMEFKIVSYKWF